MKPRHLAVTAVLTAAAVATQAASVSVYGKLDTALHIQKDRGQSAQLTMMNEGSRFGFNIKEELTSDVTIKGYLENGFASDTGALSATGGGNVGATLFDRRSILAVSSKTYGELGFGRMGSVRSTISPYSLAMGWLDPMETAYGDIASISNMFGNDPRGNNTMTWVSPRWAGLKVGITGSLATTDDEADQADKNNRLLSLGANYEIGGFGVYGGATKIWYGYDPDVASTADAGKKYRRQDAEAYLLGTSWKATESLKLFLAGQYQKNWRSVAGWNAEKDLFGKAKAADVSAADRNNGITGWSGLTGLQFWPTAQLRLIADVAYFDGEHKMADGSKVKAKRTVVNTAAEYKFSKTTQAYITLSRSWGRELLDTDTANTWISHIGLQHWF